jgi:hypothetical protein
MKPVASTEHIGHIRPHDANQLATILIHLLAQRANRGCGHHHIANPVRKKDANSHWPEV